MSFRLVSFGELAVYRANSGERIALPRKALGILGVLAANTARPVTRERLTALLWPEAGGPGATGRGALKQTIYELRQALGTPEVILGTAELTLDPAIIASDVAELEMAHGANDHARIAELYQGPFMDGYQLRDSAELDHWLDARRAHYARLFREAIEALADAAARRGDHAERIALWRRAAAQDPLDSRASLALMQALADAGDRAGALVHYQLHERLLREQLEVSPEPSVSAMAEQIRNGERASVAPEVATPALTAASPVFSPAASLGAAPSRRHGRAVLLMTGAALAIPAVLLATTLLAPPRFEVLRSIPVASTAALRLAALPQLNTVFLDGGASFTAELQALAGDSANLTRLGTGSGVATDPTTYWIWSGDYGGRFVTVRNGRTHAEIGRIPVPGCPHSFAIAAELVFVAQQCDDHISVIDRRERSVRRHIPVPTLSREEVGGAKGVGDIFVNRATGIAYFAKDGVPYRLDPATWEMREVPDFDGPVIGINEITNRVYAKIENGLRIMDGTSERLIREIQLDGNPGRAVAGLAGDRVYVTTDAGLTVLDGLSDRVLFTARVGEGFRPDAIAVDAGRHRVYVAGNEADGSRSLKIVALRD